MPEINYDELYELAKSNNLSSEQIIIVALRMSSIDLALRLSEKFGKDIKDISMEDLITDQIGADDEGNN
jgi:hypothetical protein